MSEYMIQGQTLAGIADAIRAQLGTQQQYTPESMAAAIGSIQARGTDTPADEIISGNAILCISKNASKIKDYLFFGDTIVKSCCFPAALKFGYNSFRAASKLETIYCPSCTNTGNSACIDDTALKWVALSGGGTIVNNTFLRCSSLVALILLGDSIAELQNANALSDTPIELGTGYIYVNENLVNQYKVETNWSVYEKQIKGRSEIPAEVQEWLDQQGGASA